MRPHELRALKDKATELALAGQTRRALEVFEQIERAEPDEPRWTLKVAECQRSVGNLAAAVEAYRRACGTFQRQGHDLKAIAAVRAALQLQPNNPDVARLLATLTGTAAPAAPVNAPPAPAVHPPQPTAAPARTDPLPPVQPPVVPRAPVAPPPAVRPPSPAFTPPRPDAPRAPLIFPKGRPIADEPPAPRPTAPQPPPPRVNDAGPRRSATLDRIRISQHLPAMRTAARTPGVIELDLGPAQADESYEEIAADDVEEVRASIPPAAAPSVPKFRVPLPPPPAPPAPPRDELIIEEDFVDDGGSPEALDALVSATAAPSENRVEVLPSLPPIGGGARVEAAQLRAIPLLGSLPGEALEAFVQRIEHREVAAGERVVAEGDIAEDVYLVVSGQLVVTVGDPPRPLARLVEGSFFGEMALLADAPRGASVTALSDCELLVLPRALVLEISEAYPSVLANLMQALRSRLVSTFAHTSPLFAHVPPEEHAGLVARFKLREIDAGTAFITPSARADGLYVLLTGRARADSEADAASVELGPGDVAGEASLLSPAGANLTITAVTDLLALVLPARDFRELIMVHPGVLEHLVALSDEREQRLARGARTV